jgi:plasmid stabilization system protein ParE
MARVVVTARAERDISMIIRSHGLPSDARDRLKRSLRPLEAFPELGAQLGAPFAGQRFLLGPWRWMIVIYELDPGADAVVVLRVIDGRTSTSPTAAR